MSKVRNDYRVYPYYATANPDIEQWQVRSGVSDVITTCRDLDKAESIAAALNRDPYYLERGNTQKDRANMQAPVNANTYK